VLPSETAILHLQVLPSLNRIKTPLFWERLLVLEEHIFCWAKSTNSRVIFILFMYTMPEYQDKGGGLLLLAVALTQNAKFFGTKLKTCGSEGVCLFGALDPPGGGFGHLLLVQLSASRILNKCPNFDCCCW
jgi:hypothetical protein